MKIKRIENVLMADHVGQEICDKIFKTTKLTASYGVAVNGMHAKIVADMNKSNG